MNPLTVADDRKPTAQEYHRDLQRQEHRRSDLPPLGALEFGVRRGQLIGTVGLEVHDVEAMDGDAQGFEFLQRRITGDTGSGFSPWRTDTQRARESDLTRAAE